MSTKIALLSDLHLEFYTKTFDIRDYLFQLYGAVQLPKTINCDVIVIAGDIHPYVHIRNNVIKAMEDHYQVPVIHVLGNHDVYNGWFNDTAETQLHEINGLKFACCTLWTQLQPTDVMYAHGMNDFRLINEISFDRWNEINKEHTDFIFKTNADVVVTHHTPTTLSIADRFAGNAYNCFFNNNFDNRIQEIPNTKLWLFGHTHHKHSYKIGNTEFHCNPLAYPGELYNTPFDYPIEILEI